MERISGTVLVVVKLYLRVNDRGQIYAAYLNGVKNNLNGVACHLTKKRLR